LAKVRGKEKPTLGKSRANTQTETKKKKTNNKNKNKKNCHKMISAILFLTPKGDVIISRAYRGDVPRTVADTFRQRVIASKESAAPVFLDGDTSFVFTRAGRLYVVAVTRSNVNAMMALELLSQLARVLEDYFGGAVSEEKIRGNLPLVYELLDETVDFGYPQNCEVDTLKLFIMNGSAAARARDRAAADPGSVTIQATGKIPWRAAGVKYRRNEVFLDVVETVHLLVSPQGNVLDQSVAGVVNLKCFLSGMPECKLAMNDKIPTEVTDGAPAARKGGAIELDDITFHQCVRLHNFDSDRSISFIPPDGDCELMRYRVTANIHPPFTVVPTVTEHGRTRVEIKCSIKSNYPANTYGTGVICRLPCPDSTAGATITVTAGKARYQAEEGAIVWKIKRFRGECSYSLSAEVALASTTKDTPWSRPPISMSFTVPHPASGLQIRSLKIVEKSIPEAIKWVRYVAKSSNSYEHRI
jgi:AP-2 complex subunit mu-1